MDLAQQIALWADRLRDVAAMGLYFARNIYDQESFRAIQDVALEMQALATGQAPEALEPLRETVYSRPTPLVGADAGIVDAGGRLLLIRRADNGLWAMPGGAVEVGETPAEGALREALEETGVRAQATALVGVFDSRRCGTSGPHHLYHLVFLCEPLDLAHAAPSHALEVTGMGWFTEDRLPAELAPGHAARIPHVFRVWHGQGQAFFDGQAS